MSKNYDDKILLANKIRLAEKGMGCTRVDGTTGLWQDAEGLRWAITQYDHVLPQWSPYTNFRHAGMLMRALGIDLLLHDDEGPYWLATDSDGRANVSGRGEGNTEPAMCEAVCRCALKILKAREAK